MENFNLQHQIVVFDNGQANVRLFPTNLGLVDKMETFRLYESEAEAEADIDDFVAEMLPIMYNDIDLLLKPNYRLL